MTRKIGIATADKALFDILRSYLILAQIGGLTNADIDTDPPPDAAAAATGSAPATGRCWCWMAICRRLPAAARPRQGENARTLVEQARDSGIRTPMLVIMQSALTDLEAYCVPAKRAIALPLDQLRSHRAAIVKPFLATLMDQPDQTGAIPGTFRVIEVDFRKDRSICWLGYDDDNTTLLKWSVTSQLRGVRNAARLFSDTEIYSRHGWIDHVRTNGEMVFGSHVMDAIGTGLFAHIEQAAGGLQRLSFRYVITDPELYSAPFEGSVRSREDNQEAPFVLLKAPVVRRLPAPAVIGVSRHRSAGLPPAARVLFIRSQMSEHPDGATEDDQLTVRFKAGGMAMEKTLSFGRLGSIDHELDQMSRLAESVGTERMMLEAVNLSKFQRDGAAEFLRRKLTSEKYDLVHYAGHAWSSGFDGREANLLVLPGRELGQAVGFPIDEFAELAAATEARFVYLSACRGSSTRSLQSFVAQGVPHALGFRCNVEDKRAAALASAFYSSLFESRSLCRSFRAACAEARRCLETDEEDPIWVTPIMLAQTADWAMRA